MGSKISHFYNAPDDIHYLIAQLMDLRDTLRMEASCTRMKKIYGSKSVLIKNSLNPSMPHDLPLSWIKHLIRPYQSQNDDITTVILYNVKPKLSSPLSNIANGKKVFGGQEDRFLSVYNAVVSVDGEDKMARFWEVQERLEYNPKFVMKLFSDASVLLIENVNRYSIVGSYTERQLVRTKDVPLFTVKRNSDSKEFTAHCARKGGKHVNLSKSDLRDVEKAFLFALGLAWKAKESSDIKIECINLIGWADKRQNEMDSMFGYERLEITGIPWFEEFQEKESYIWKRPCYACGMG